MIHFKCEYCFMNYVDEFVKSSVFVYLAHQGIVLLTVIIGGFFGLCLVPECHDFLKLIFLFLFIIIGSIRICSNLLLVISLCKDLFAR